MFLCVDRVTKSYRTRGAPLPALDPVSFDVQEGEFVSIVGPSGCGKTSLLMIIAGLIRPSSGTVTINSRPIVAPNTKLGIVFQQDVLLEWRTVLQNILLQGQLRGLDKTSMAIRARDLLALVGLEEFADKYPYELSGGMRQRVAICRALLHDPDLLLMDEPFGALDALTRDQLNQDLLRYRREKGKTVVFVTHSISEAVFLSDRVLVMSPRPGHVADTLLIDLPSPRTLEIRETPRFGAHVGRIIRTFESVGVLKK
jgi:NitT/TauT family transport system ATP-binding protein